MTAAFILGGCSAKEVAVEAASKPTAASPATTPVLTPTPTPAKPTPLTAAQAAKVYLAAVVPRNKTTEKFGDDLDDNASMKTLRADAARARSAERHFLDVLDKTLWPASVVKNTASLSTCTASLIAWFDSVTRVKDKTAITAAPDCGGADAQLIRARLGLSSNTG
jgi:hypothetical protein